MMEFLSPHDSMKINNPEYKELKRKTIESQRIQFDTEGNEFILKQLGTPLLKHRNSSSSSLQKSASRQSPKKGQNHSPIILTNKPNGRSNSVQTLYSSSHLIGNSSVQLPKIESTKRMSIDMQTPTKANHNLNLTPMHSSRKKFQAVRTPSNFSKRNLGTNESESFIVTENNNTSQVKESRGPQPAQFGNQSNRSNLNISNIIQNMNSNNKHHHHQILSKSVVYEEPVKYAWSEIKFKGKLCEGRSFSQAVVYNNQFYFYGGYDSSKGVYKDFVYLTFSQSSPSQFHKVELSHENKETPGRLCRHGAVLRGNSMVIFGGKSSSLKSTNSMFEYSFEQRKFQRITPILSNPEDLPKDHHHHHHISHHYHQVEGKMHVLMPPLDSHSMIYDLKNDQLIVSGGFLGDSCEYSMDIYTFSFNSNSWAYIPSKTNIDQMPVPRGAHGSILSFNKLYIFGGTDGENILEDMWYFDMDAHTWTKIDYSSQRIQPGPRSGIQMLEFEGYFVVFGGFKSLINERNDLVLFDSRKMEWVYQSERKEIVEMVQTQSMPTSPTRVKQITSAKKSIGKHLIQQPYRFDSPIKSGEKQSGVTYQFGQHSQLNSPLGKKHYAPLHQKDEVNDFVLKNRESKQKLNFEKKMQLLKQFEVHGEQRNQLLSLTPILQSMKSSLHLLSACNQSHRYDQINETQLKSQNFQNTESQIKGKHPGARDGYLCAIINDKLVIFGGDRHRMSLNDTYHLDLTMILDYLKRL